MAISRQRKEEFVAQYAELLSKSQVSIWADHSGLSVAALTDLRSKTRPYGATIRVTKNTLLKRAIEQCGWPIPDDYLIGPTALVFLGEEIAAPSKALADFAKENKEFVVKGGLSAKGVMTAAQVSDLASLPTKDVLLAQVLGGLQAPITGFVNVLAGNLRGLVNVLKARSEQLEGASS